MLKYANRLLALGYILWMVALTSSAVGTPSSGAPMPWYVPWVIGFHLGVAAWLGWRARGEHGA